MLPVVSYLTLFDVKALKDLVRPLFDKGWHKINCYSIGQCSILLSPSSITGGMKSFLTVDLGQLSIVLSLIGLHMEFIITYLTCFFHFEIYNRHKKIIHVSFTSTKSSFHTNQFSTLLFIVCDFVREFLGFSDGLSLAVLLSLVKNLRFVFGGWKLFSIENPVSSENLCAVHATG
jgi:hypothetical protein